MQGQAVQAAFEQDPAPSAYSVSSQRPCPHALPASTCFWASERLPGFEVVYIPSKQLYVVQL